MIIPPPAKQRNRWCKCGHSEFRHHAINWSCLVDGCSCDRFTGKEGDATCKDTVKNAMNFTQDHCLVLQSDAAPTVQPAGAAQSQEWTAGYVRGLQQTGWQAVADAHNAELAAERKRVTTLEYCLGITKEELAAERKRANAAELEVDERGRTIIHYKQQLAAEREQHKQELGRLIESNAAKVLAEQEKVKVLILELRRISEFLHTMPEIIEIARAALAKVKEVR
jgi:hypothetical protein